MGQPERYAFGDFELERSQQRVCHRDGTQLSLTPRVFSALLLFLERPGALLDKNTLMEALWPGLVVEENNLSQVVSNLRRALGDDVKGERYIQTVPRRGFRFVAAVTTLDDSARPVPTTPEEPARPVVAANPTAVGALPRRRWLWLAGGGAAVAATSGAWWLAGHWRLRGATSNHSTLAVLPFKPLILVGRDELLEVGMADSLIARLSTIQGIVVRSVGSVRRYAGPDQDPLRAAHELDVVWIVDGSLQRRGEQLHVTARLLSVPDGAAAWSGSFDERMTNVFDVQDNISDKISGVLAASLDPGKSANAGNGRLGVSGGVDVGGTRNADAYQLYLTARLHAQGIRADGLRKSAELYNEAIEIDPGYAQAYAGLVETYRRMAFGADVVPADAFSPATVAARRALELAPRLAAGHAGLGWVRYWYDFDWAGAEAVFRRAIELNPNVVEAHFGLGLLLVTLDRPDEGLKHLKAARELDPVSLILNTLESAFLFERGRRDEALARLDRVFRINPDFWVAHLTLAMRQAREGRGDEALASFRRAEKLADGSTQALASLGMHLARMGAPDEARQIRDRLLALQKVRYVPPTSVATVHAALGETPQALDALDRAFTVRDTRLVYLKDDLRWASLRGEPRFGELMRRMHLDGLGKGEPAP